MPTHFRPADLPSAGLLLAGLISIAGCAGSAVKSDAVLQAGLPPPGSTVSRVVKEAQDLKPIIQSRYGQEILAAAVQLPPIAARRIFVAPDNLHAYTQQQVKALPGFVQGRFREQVLDEEAYYYTAGRSPLWAALYFDLLAVGDRGGLIGRRVLDLGATSIGTIRLLAALGVDATAVSPSWVHKALYSQPGDQGTVPLYGRDLSGHLAWITGSPTLDPPTLVQVGAGYDFVICQGFLRRGSVHPSEGAPTVPLPGSDEQFLQTLFALLRPGGRLLVYNICPIPPLPVGVEKPTYDPATDCRDAFTQAQWQAAGFRVRDFDRPDAPSAQRVAHAIAWPGPLPPASSPQAPLLHAQFTLVERP